MENYSGKQKFAFCQRLGNKWEELADYFDISYALQSQYPPGEKAREIWVWLLQTEKQYELVDAEAGRGLQPRPERFVQTSNLP